jgi:hypothetical protein
VARVPAVDGSPDGLLSFNGTVADMAANPLSDEEPDLPKIRVKVNGVEFQGGTSPEDDFQLYITPGDGNGQHKFTVVNLPIAPGVDGFATVSVFAEDASGNLSPQIDTRVQVGTEL